MKGNIQGGGKQPPPHPHCCLFIDTTGKLGFYNVNLTPENDTD